MNESKSQGSNLENKQLSLDIQAIQIENIHTLPTAKKGTASSLRIHYKDFGETTFLDHEIFSKLPQHPFWSQVDKLVDFSFADELCASLYSPLGQKPFAPSFKLKVHLVQAFENLSDREMELRILFDIGIKRFLGVPLSFTGFDHSTIGLDRDRMGAELFHACFHYILAQAFKHKLWGSNGDRWLIDSFHTYANSIKMSAYRLVFHGMLNIVQQLKRANRSLFNLLEKTHPIGSWFKKLPFSSTPEERAAQFSQLVARAYALLAWFERDGVHHQFWDWADKKKQLRSLELQAILYKILLQNTRQKPIKPADPTKPTVAKEIKELTESSIDEMLDGDYEKIPSKERPANRIVNAHDPDVRSGNKSPTTFFLGDKEQVVLEDNSQFILEIEPIPGNEHDGRSLVSVVSKIIEVHGIKPHEIVGDSHYGSIPNRLAIQKEEINLCAPIPNFVNTRGLYSKNMFTYNEESRTVLCPAGKYSKNKHTDKIHHGIQHGFAAKDCNNCPLLKECTTSSKGRRIFIHDEYKLIQDAEAYNVTENGKAALTARNKIERTNNELANFHGLRSSRTRGRESTRITAKLKGIAVNVKLMVKHLGKVVADPFVRYPRSRKVVSLCS